MSQTGYMFFSLILAFIVFVTLRGELSRYLGVIGMGGNVPAAPPTNSTPGATQSPGIDMSTLGKIGSMFSSSASGDW